MSFNIMGQGDTVKAEALKDSLWLFAIGSGSADWDALPPEGRKAPKNTQALESHIIYVRPHIIGYAKEDPGGFYPVAGGKNYNVDPAPQELLLAQIQILAGAIPEGTIIREFGLFHAPTIAADVPEGQVIIPTEKVSQPGKLYGLGRYLPETMTPGKSLKRTVIFRP